TKGLADWTIFIDMVLGAAHASMAKRGAGQPGEPAESQPPKTAPGEERPTLAKKPAASGHSIEVDPEGIKLCSPRPCPLLRQQYHEELEQDPKLEARMKQAEAMRATNPDAAAEMSQKLELDLLDRRIANTEAELQPARQRTIDYQAQRKAAGESLKGGPI